MEVMGTRVEGSVLVISLRLNINLTSQTIDEAVGKRHKVVSGMCDDILLEVKNSTKGEAWSAVYKQMNDDGKLKLVINDHAQRQLAEIKARGAQEFNIDKVLLDEMQKVLSVGSGIRLQRAAVLDQAANAMEDSPALAQASRSLAVTWRQDESVEKDVTLKFKMDHPPNGELWLLTVLGFQPRADGALEVSPVEQYTDKRSNKAATALSTYACREQIKDHTLAAIDGDRDLARMCSQLQAGWKEGGDLFVTLTLGHDHTTQEALESFRKVALTATSGDVEVVARRLMRFLEVNPGLEHIQELNCKGWRLSDEAGAAIARALSMTSTASVILVKMMDNPGLSRQAACAFGCLLASSKVIQELGLVDCELGEEDIVALFEAVAQHPGASPLRKLALTNNVVGGRGAATLAAAVKAGTLEALEELWLFNCQLGEKCAMALLEALAQRAG
eukprot:CAMPEP_0203846480 /NCGR_PEP_ID=MMETSP0359-20131031/4457_1 /ASSEMBLY_ACC=CAM_ASM_000338 /TAXON_ID=268821 /ORGANISM="Scrippsiella Hangoei, Strain SHTV-5" /LENGTH=445 /DNA_ID=CAMNT_0050761819 /DNA_START=33 /DNA_END=1367 /DNA_ORIENTATION=-